MFNEVRERMKSPFLSDLPDLYVNYSHSCMRPIWGGEGRGGMRVELLLLIFMVLLLHLNSWFHMLSLFIVMTKCKS